MKSDSTDRSPRLDLPLAPPVSGDGREGSVPLSDESDTSHSASLRRPSRRKPMLEAADSLPLFAGVEIERTPAPAEEVPRVARSVRSPSRTESPPEKLERAPVHPTPKPQPSSAQSEPRLRQVSSRTPPELSRPTFLQRVQGGLGDLLILAGVGATALLGAGALGVSTREAHELLPVGVFLLAWSFLYLVVPLAFWGQSPGMAWAGVRARSGDGPISFGQAAWRWAGFWLALLSGGLLGLLALTERSLEDRLSDSDLERVDPQDRGRNPAQLSS